MVDTKALWKPGSPYLPPKSFLCGPHFFCKEKFCTGAGRRMLSFSQELETGTIRTIFPGTKSGTAGTVFQEPKPELEPCPFGKTLLKYWETLSTEEPSEPKTGTARTIPCTNSNRTKPNRGHPETRCCGACLGVFSSTHKSIKRMGIKMASFWVLKTWHFGARLFWYPFRCLEPLPSREVAGSIVGTNHNLFN